MKPTAKTKVERVAQLEWVPLDAVKVNPLAQRELNRARVDRLAADFDPEQLGSPTVNRREGHYWIVDGQHRIEALKEWLGDWEGLYVGFQKAPHDKGRFAKREHANGDDYHPCALFASWPLTRLPSDSEFLAALSDGDE